MTCKDYNYCKRGYFRWGKISRKCWQDISRGGNFHDTTHISFIKAGGFYFRVGVIFAMKNKSAKNAKITPSRKFPRLQYYVSHKVETHENRQFFSTGMEFAENAYASVLKAPSRS